MLLIQNDHGSVAGANAYISRTFFDDYHASRGNAVPQNDDFVTGVTIVDGGTNYDENDILTAASGTSTEKARIEVLTVDGGGVILTARVIDSGSYSVDPSDPDSPTGGLGTGASLSYTIGNIGQAIEQSIIRATDYLDNRFRWIGYRQQLLQRTQWPRLDAEDRDELMRFGIPIEVKEACAEYALIALKGTLNPAPVRDTTGARVASFSKSVGPISKSVTFAAAGSYQMPIYPEADHRLKASGLVVSGGTIRRS